MSEKNSMNSIKVMGDNLVTCANENCAHAKCTPVLDEIITKYD